MRRMYKRRLWMVLLILSVVFLTMVPPGLSYAEGEDVVEFPPGSSISVGEVTDSSFAISWPWANNAVFFSVYINGIRYAGGLMSNSYTATGLSPGTGYSVTVVPTDGGWNEYPTSLSTSVTTESPPSTPTFPPGSSITVTNLSETGFSIDWPWASGAVYYSVYVNYTRVAGGLLSNDYTITGLSPGSSYHVMVVPTDGGWNEYPDTLSATVFTQADTTGTFPPGSEITVTDVTDAGFTITWPWADGAVYHSIYVNGSFYAGGLMSNNYTFTGLSPDTSYNVTVVSTDGGWNEYPYSLSTTATTGSVVTPSFPPGSEITASNETDTSVGLSWPWANGAYYYDVYQDGVKVLDNTISNAYIVTGLTPNTTYEFEVWAADSLGNTYGEPLRLSVYTQSTWPAGGYLSASNATSSTVDLTWPYANNAAYYNVYANGVLFQANVSSNFVTVDGLNPDTSYTFEVRAVDSWMEEYGQPLILTVETDPIWPEGSSLTATNIGETSMGLYWPTANDAYYYNVYQDDSLLDTTLSNSITVEGLTPGTSYIFRIVPTDLYGNEFGEALTITETTQGDNGGGGTGGAWPAGSSLTAQYVMTTRVDLQWPAASNAAFYNVYKNGLKYNASLISDQSIKVTGLSPGTAYTFDVRAADVNGVEFGAGLSVTVTTNTVWPVGSQAAVSDITSTSVKLTWPDATGEYFLKVNVYVNGIYYGTEDTANDMLITGLTPGTSYTLKVQGVNWDNAEYGQPLTVTVTTLPADPANPDKNGDGKVDIYDIVIVAKEDPSKLEEMKQPYQEAVDRYWENQRSR